MHLFDSILLAFLAMGCLFCIQIIVAHIAQTRNEDKFIILLYVILPALAFIFLWTQQFYGWGIDACEAVMAYLIFFVISISWVASYPAIYAACPTLMMTFIIHKSKQGSTLEDLRKQLGLKNNSTERIKDATHNRLIKRNGENIELTSLGLLVFKFFRAYRRILGLKMDTI